MSKMQNWAGSNHEPAQFFYFVFKLWFMGDCVERVHLTMTKKSIVAVAANTGCKIGT